MRVSATSSSVRVTEQLKNSRSSPEPCTSAHRHLHLIRLLSVPYLFYGLHRNRYGSWVPSRVQSLIGPTHAPTDVAVEHGPCRITFLRHHCRHNWRLRDSIPYLEHPRRFIRRSTALTRTVQQYLSESSRRRLAQDTPLLPSRREPRLSVGLDRLLLHRQDEQ